jgi:hypothetical protein
VFVWDVWLHTFTPPWVAWAVLALVAWWVLGSPLVTWLRSRRGGDRAVRRTGRRMAIQYVSQVLLVGLLLTAEPEVTAASMGLSPPLGRQGIIAICLTLGTVLIGLAHALTTRAIALNRGQYVLESERQQNLLLRNALLSGPRDAFLFLVLPLFAASALDLPVAWFAVGCVLAYGFSNRQAGFAAAVLWTMYGAAAAVAYLLAASALLPMTLLTTTLVTWLLALPLRPPPPPKHPPLTLVSDVVGVPDGELAGAGGQALAGQLVGAVLAARTTDRR